jgi:hypothetical protein
MPNPGIASRSAVATLRTGDYLLSPLKVLSAGRASTARKRRPRRPKGPGSFAGWVSGEASGSGALHPASMTQRGVARLVPAPRAAVTREARGSLQHFGQVWAQYIATIVQRMRVAARAVALEVSHPRAHVAAASVLLDQLGNAVAAPDGAAVHTSSQRPLSDAAVLQMLRMQVRDRGYGRSLALPWCERSPPRAWSPDVG